jgi:3-oxoacyl-[acyl-carrier-protein] synthase II
MPTMRVAVTGVAAISPIGIAKETFWQALIHGQDGITDIEAFDTSGFRTHRGGEIKNFSFQSSVSAVNHSCLGRASQFAITASRMALEDAHIDPAGVDPRRVGVACGTTMGESQIFEAMDARFVNEGFEAVDAQLIPEYKADVIAANVAREFRLRGPVTMLTTACAAGNYAIAAACDLLNDDSADFVLAGGSDPLSRIAFTGFNSMFAVAPVRCQPFDRNRKGMCVSEGCGMLVLERMQDAQARGAHIYCEVAACGISNDGHHMTSPHPRGRGAVAAMTKALQEAQVEPRDVDYISAHGTGTPANDKIETAAIKQVFGEWAYGVPVSSIKSMLGHTLGAASALEAVTCALCIERGVIPPTINYCDPDPECDLDYVPNVAREHKVEIALSNSFAFGGNCAALLLKAVRA